MHQLKPPHLLILLIRRQLTHVVASHSKIRIARCRAYRCPRKAVGRGDPVWVRRQSFFHGKKIVEDDARAHSRIFDRLIIQVDHFVCRVRLSLLNIFALTFEGVLDIRVTARKSALDLQFCLSILSSFLSAFN